MLITVMLNRSGILHLAVHLQSPHLSSGNDHIPSTSKSLTSLSNPQRDPKVSEEYMRQEEGEIDPSRTPLSENSNYTSDEETIAFSY